MSFLDSVEPKYIAAGAVGLTALAWMRGYFAGGVCDIKQDLRGQVVIVTGSNTGIGKETAKVLAGMGATVILANRDEARTRPVLDQIKKETKNENVEFIRLDLSDLKSVKEFADNFKRRYQKLNILINNAGVMAIPDRTETKDGFEMQFGTNHMGHFYLTTLLLDVLKKSAPSRIINVSSNGHYFTKSMDWDDLMGTKNYNMNTAYFRSKLANVIFTRELQRRVADSNIKVVSLHPGAVTTDLARYLAERWYWKIALNLIARPIFRIFGKNPLQGAQTTLYCALEDFDELKAGAYYTDCKVKAESPEALKEENGKKLWNISEKLISEKAPK